ncbi:MAG: hypothetical protein DCC75_10285 [Proteobacteria bacterium]|nr:MAG: hypothetical protein DCC75_10285 [Pseudomonadota bacterium]
MILKAITKIGRSLNFLTLIMSFSIFLPACTAQVSQSEMYASMEFGVRDLRGWNYLAGKMIQAGVPKQRVHSLLSDPRMPEFTYVPFKLRPKETKQMYWQFTTDSSISQAAKCLNEFRPNFTGAEQSFGVSANILAALITIETHCGKNIGKEMVFYRLARVSSVGESENLARNHKEHRELDSKATFEDTRARAEYLESTFFPEILALLKVADTYGFEIFDLKGSVAGAFGIPQFLPSSFLQFGVDGDRDGSVSLFFMSDAVPSAANYLRNFGWREDLNTAAKRKVLLKYNKSEAYADAVIKMAVRLKSHKSTKNS